MIIHSSEVVIYTIPQVAVGTETVEGYKMLSHLELCEFYPALIAALRMLSAGATDALLLPQQLPFLDHYPKLIKVSHKGLAVIYQSLFEEIKSDSCEMVRSLPLLLRATPGPSGSKLNATLTMVSSSCSWTQTQT